MDLRLLRAPVTIGTRLVPALALLGAVTLLGMRAGGGEVSFAVSRIYWEYNASANDLGVHVSLDGEDWKSLQIRRPVGSLLFQAAGKGPYKTLGMTELFFEGAEPSLDEVPLAELLAMFPEGEYEFEGLTVDGEEIEGEADFSHAIPDGPQVSATVGGGDYLLLEWTPVTMPPPGFPNLPIAITGYQVLVEPSFQVTLPATVFQCTVSPEFVASLPSGVNKFEVLAVDQSGNQTITEGTFVK